jgi:DNA-binding XRE family transcriptional regulator
MKNLEDWNDLGIARVNLDLTQQQMAEAIGVGLRTYQNWERHISKPTEFVQIEVIAKINQMLSK